MVEFGPSCNQPLMALELWQVAHYFDRPFVAFPCLARMFSRIIMFICCLSATTAICLAPAIAAPAAIQSSGVDQFQHVPDSGAPITSTEPSTGWILFVYCTLIIIASLCGGWIPAYIELTHTRMQTIISFVGGLMLGIGVFHLLPHAIHELPNATIASRWLMVGIVFMFVMLRLFHFHNHEPVSAALPAAIEPHDHHAATGEHHSTAECHSHSHAHGLSWLGIAIGLSVHTLIDGIALGVSVNAEAASATTTTLFGLGVFLAIALHKPLDAVSITSLMKAGGWKNGTINLVNFAFALMCPLGAGLAMLGVHQFPAFRQEILGTALAFSAGVFICISLSDLLPEMEFHSHNKVQLSIALGLGIVLAWAITFLEPAHLH